MEWPYFGLQTIKRGYFRFHPKNKGKKFLYLH